MAHSLSFTHFRKIAEQHPSSEGHRFVLGGKDHLHARPLNRTLFGKAKKITPQEKLENRKAWLAFKKCVEDAPLANPSRLKTIFSNCYRYGLDFDRNAMKGEPLCPIDVEKVGVAAGFLKTSDILVPGESRRRLTPPEIQRRMEEADPFHFFGTIPDEQWHNGGPVSVKEYLESDAFLSEQRLLRVFSLAPYLYPHRHAFSEHLAKGMLTSEPTEETIIPAPDCNRNIDYYQVDKRIETKAQGGLFALLLTPLSGQSKLPTILGFRPTQMKIGSSGPLASLSEDAKKEIGKKSYLAAKDQLAEVLRAGDGKIVGVGYSKGGTELQRCFIDNWQHFSEVVFFNDPSMEKEPVEEFARMINSLPPQARKRTITIYRTQGDITHFGGEKHIGWGIKHPDFIVKVIEIKHPTFAEQLRMYQIPRLLERHSARHFIENDIAENSILKIWEGRAADSQLDNTRRGEHIVSYESFRQRWGAFIFKVANCFYKLLVRIGLCLGFKIDKKSLEHA